MQENTNDYREQLKQYRQEFGFVGTGKQRCSNEEELKLKNLKKQKQPLPDDVFEHMDI